MKKRVVSMALAIIFCFSVCITAYAAEVNEFIYDESDHLTTNEISDLNTMAQQIYDNYGIYALCVLSSDVPNDNLSQFASQYYNKKAGTAAGIILAVNITNDEYYIYESGRASNIFSNDNIKDIGNKYGDDTQYYSGIQGYLKLTGDTLALKGVQPVPESREKSLLVDNGDLLTDSEEQTVLAKLNSVSEKQNCDVAVVTIESLNGKTATQYADDYYDYNGYGVGSSKDGILFLISINDRKWALSTKGSCITAFTDKGQSYIMDQIKPDLKNDKFEAAFMDYANLCDQFLTQAKTGKAYDVNNMPFTPLSIMWIPISLLIGALISLIIMSIAKGKLKTVRFQPAAGSYIRQNSMRLTENRDVYLYHHVSKSAKPKDTGSSSGGGGSSTHTSSSGSTHGGSSGDF